MQAWGTEETNLKITKNLVQKRLTGKHEND